ncbi:MAG: hypothetical protein ABS939_00075 [Psychrobacillus sp.]
MKKVMCLFLLFSLLFPSVAFAESGNSCGPVLTDEKKEVVQNFQDGDASLQEAYTIDILQAIWNMANINTLNTLIFGNPYCIWFDNPEEELVFGIFTKEQKENIIDPVFHMFTGLFTVALLISMMMTGMKMGLKPLGTRVQFTEELWMYISVCFLIAVYWIFIEQILNINWAITGAFKDLLLAQGIDLSSSTIVATQDDFNFTDIIIMFAEWVLMLFLNFVYVLRTFMITILLCLGGLAILSLLYQSTRSFFGTWVLDFVGAVFVQSIHALYLSIVLLFVSQLEGEMSVVIKLLLLILFLPLTSAIMNWMNLSSGGLASSVGLSGVNSVGAAVAMSKRLKGMQKPSGGKFKSPELSSLRTTRISATASGNASKSWQTAKSLTSKVGMGVGAAAGSVLGPGGMALGASVGSKGAALLQAPRNLAGGIKGTADTVKGIKKEGFNNVMGDLQKRRMFFGNMGESVGAMVGAGGAGRGMGEALSGVSRQRLANSSENGGLGGVTLEGLAKKYPGGDISFMQTNQGSGFYLNDGTQLVSPMGAADPNLANGEIRKVDYKFGGSDMRANETGEYSSINTMGQGSLIRNSEAYIQSPNGGKFNDPRFQASSISPDDYFRSGMKGAEQRNMSDRVADKIGRHPGFV